MAKLGVGPHAIEAIDIKLLESPATPAKVLTAPAGLTTRMVLLAVSAM
jgi:hypothetical protein